MKGNGSNQAPSRDAGRIAEDSGPPIEPLSDPEARRRSNMSGRTISKSNIPAAQLPSDYSVAAESQITSCPCSTSQAAMSSMSLLRRSIHMYRDRSIRIVFELSFRFRSRKMT